MKPSVCFLLLVACIMHVAQAQTPAAERPQLVYQYNDNLGAIRFGRCPDLFFTMGTDRIGVWDSHSFVNLYNLPQCFLDNAQFFQDSAGTRVLNSCGDLFYLLQQQHRQLQLNGTVTDADLDYDYMVVQASDGEGATSVYRISTMQPVRELPPFSGPKLNRNTVITVDEQAKTMACTEISTGRLVWQQSLVTSRSDPRLHMYSLGKVAGPYVTVRIYDDRRWQYDSTHEEGRVQLYNLRDGRFVKELPVSDLFSDDHTLEVTFGLHDTTSAPTYPALPDRDAIVLDVQSKKELFRFPITDGIPSISFSPDNHLLFINVGNDITIYDVRYHSMVARLAGTTNKWDIRNVSYDDAKHRFSFNTAVDGRMILNTRSNNIDSLCYQDFHDAIDTLDGFMIDDYKLAVVEYEEKGSDYTTTYQLYDADGNKIGKAFRCHNFVIDEPVFSADHRSLFMGSFSNGKRAVTKVDLSTGVILQAPVAGNFFRLVVNADCVSANPFDADALVFDANTLQLVERFKQGVLLARSTSHTLYIAAEKKALVWDSRLRKLKTEIAIPDFDKIAVTNDEKYFICQRDSLLMQVDIATGKIIRKKIVPEIEGMPLMAIYTIENNTRLVLEDWHHSLYLFDFATWEPLLSVYPGKGRSVLLITADQQYFNPAKQYEKVAFRVNGRGYSFRQFDVLYNRPDVVLQRLGNPNTELINAFAKAYQKRVRRLNVDTAAVANGLLLPKIDILNRSQLDYEQKDPSIALHIHATDAHSRLKTLRVWINEVPLFGRNGRKVTGSGMLDTVIHVQLSAGKNVIETSVANSRGAESFRSDVQVHYTPAQQPQEKVYFIGIGINRFRDSVNNLQYSVKDIRDLAITLKQHYGDRIKIDTLFDEQVTPDNILAVKRKLLETAIQDKVILSYSGHGLLSRDYEYYLSTYDVNFDNPAQGGLPYETLESVMDSIPARRKLLLVDACHSGEVDKDEIARITKVQRRLDSLGTTTDTMRRSHIVITGKHMGLVNSFELMQSLFVNVSRGTGATVIAAAGGMQYAQERGDLKNGVFTFSILNAFQQHGQLTILQLQNIVAESVERLTSGLQKPNSRSQGNIVDWRIW